MIMAVDFIWSVRDNIQGVPFTTVFFRRDTAPTKNDDFKNFFTGKSAMN